MNLHGVTLDALLDAATALVTVPLEAEGCPLEDATGRTLAEAITADRDLPPFNRAAMDGYALRHAEHTDTMACAGRIDAGADVELTVPEGGCVTIATGARVPPGLDTVVQHEWTSTSGDSIEFKRMPEVGANVHLQAADAAKGTVLAQAGNVLDTISVALAAACGCGTLSVRRRPDIALCTSGDEVVAAGDTPAPHQIRNSNGHMIASLVRRLGASVYDSKHLLDDADGVLAPLADLVAPADVIVTTGGISAGERDVIAAAFDDLGVTWTVIGAHGQAGPARSTGHAGRHRHRVPPGKPRLGAGHGLAAARASLRDDARSHPDTVVAHTAGRCRQGQPTTHAGATVPSG